MKVLDHARQLDRYARFSDQRSVRSSGYGPVCRTLCAFEPGSLFAADRVTVTTRSTEGKRDYVQHVPLSYTVPHYGGRRWWMHCPVNGSRVGKLYVPAGGDIFASRTAWRLGYNSQRIAQRDRPFEALFRLQKKLGCKEGWEAGLYRPKGMWNRTFERHFERYLELDAECGVEGMRMLELLRGSLKR